MEFTIGYSSKTFDGIISAGVMDVEADSIETAKDHAFDIVMRHYETNADEDEVWFQNLQNLSISVNEKSKN